MTYKASLDKTAIAITIGVTLLFLGIIVGQFAIINNNPIYTSVAFLLIYFLAFAFRPMYYIVETDTLIIHRPLSNVRILRKDIESVQRVEKGKISGAIRTFGVGGLFGYFGKFSNFTLGSMTWYATQTEKPVLVRTAGKKLILTPDLPDEFVAAFNAS